MKRELKFKVAIEIYKKYKVFIPICNLGFGANMPIYVETEILEMALTDKYDISEKEMENIYQDYEQQEGFCVFDNSDYDFLAQLVGLQDANKKEIYHKNIVKKGDTFAVVEYCKKSASFYIKYMNFNFYFNWDISQTEFEIVGNIHENPELLL